MFEVNELRRFDACISSDFDEFGGLEKALGVLNGSPDREMNNPVWIVLILENLIRAFTGAFSNAGGAVENLLPNRIVRDLVNNQNGMVG